MHLLIRFAVAVIVCGTLTSCSTPSTRTDGKPIVLFNGTDLEGWRHVLADPAVPRDQVWTVRDGAIICRGTPLGFLCTTQEFTNFRLAVEYRWAPGTKPGNSGLFSRIHGPERALPSCAEVQLMHGNAGDVLTLQGMRLGTNQTGYFHIAKHELAGDIDGVKKTRDVEAPPGAWNRVELTVEGERYRVWINGTLINEVVGVETLPGPIGLQSEGGEIHFRRVSVLPLP